MKDAWGRSTSKACPSCDDTMGRTCRVCNGCGHIFVSKHWAADQRKKGLSDTVPVLTPRKKPEPRVPKVQPAPAIPAILPAEPLEAPRLAVTVFEPDDFDCIAMPDGRLRLCLPSGEVILSARQVKIVAMELGL